MFAIMQDSGEVGGEMLLRSLGQVYLVLSAQNTGWRMRCRKNLQISVVMAQGCVRFRACDPAARN